MHGFSSVDSVPQQNLQAAAVFPGLLISVTGSSPRVMTGFASLSSYM